MKTLQNTNNCHQIHVKEGSFFHENHAETLDDFMFTM